MQKKNEKRWNITKTKIRNDAKSSGNDSMTYPYFEF